MSFGESVGIITTTLDRPDFIERILRYLQSVGFKGSFHLGDSCNDVDRARISQAIEALKGAFEVKVVNCRGLSIGESLYEASTSCTRPYASFIGDDDYCLISGVDACTEFLSQHPDYAAAHGEGYAFTLDRPGPYGNVESFVTYPMPALEQEHPLERLNFVFCHYGVILFSVMRTRTFQKIFSNLNGIKDSTIRDELIPNGLAAIEGKIKQLPFPHVLRQSHKRRHELPTTDLWVKSEHFAPSAKSFEENLSSQLIQHISAPPEELRKAAWHAMSIYIARTMAQQVLKIPLNHPNDPRGYELQPQQFMVEGAQHSHAFVDVIRSLTQAGSGAR